MHMYLNECWSWGTCSESLQDCGLCYQMTFRTNAQRTNEEVPTFTQHAFYNNPGALRQNIFLTGPVGQFWQTLDIELTLHHWSTRKDVRNGPVHELWHLKTIFTCTCTVNTLDAGVMVDREELITRSGVEAENTGKSQRVDGNNKLWATSSQGFPGRTKSFLSLKKNDSWAKIMNRGMARQCHLAAPLE